MTVRDIDPNAIDWTIAGFRAVREKPIVVGDDRQIRYQVLDEDGAAVDLTDTEIYLTVRTSEISEDIVFSRTLNTDVDTQTEDPGTEDPDPLGRKEIEIDDQTEEPETPAENETGRGWLTINFTSYPADTAEMEAVQRTVLVFDLVILFTVTNRSTEGFGQIQFKPSVKK